MDEVDFVSGESFMSWLSNMFYTIAQLSNPVAEFHQTFVYILRKGSQSSALYKLWMKNLLTESHIIHQISKWVGEDAVFINIRHF